MGEFLGGEFFEVSLYMRHGLCFYSSEIGVDDWEMVMYKQQTGWTLIELMIVVAIIGIIASIGSAQYQFYLGKSRVTAAYSEIAAGRINFQSRINNSELVTSPSDIGLLAETIHCRISVSSLYIRCELKNPPTGLNEALIDLNYDSTLDLWSCVTQNVSADFRPKGCS